jgi:hypothetical protein
MGSMGFPPHEIDKAREDMIVRLNKPAAVRFIKGSGPKMDKKDR